MHTQKVFYNMNKPDHNQRKKERIATDPVYKQKINLRERMRKIWERQCPLRLAVENIHRRKAQAKRMSNPKNREKERKRQRDWYHRTKDKNQKKISGLDLLKDSIF